MVQHGTSTKSMAVEGINEFQVVHALITQSVKGCAENSLNSAACDENENKMTAVYCGSLLSSICQKINSFNSSSRHRLIAQSVKDIISQLRKSQDCCTPPPSSANKTSHKVSNKKKEKVSLSSKSTVALQSPVKPSTSDCTLPQKEVQLLSSNVHSKVLHFERCANSFQAEDDRCITCKKTEPSSQKTAPSASASCVEACPGGTFYRPKPQSSRPPSPPADRPDPPKLTGRNLKRVPSEKFQKTRRKLQRLMQHRDDEDKTPRSPVDDASFLKSIRIPNPAQVRQDPESGQCMFLRLPDHVLCQIFSWLDTRTLSAVKCVCTDFHFIIVNFDIRSSDSLWTKDDRYIDDPCKQCRRQYVRGDTSMCRYHPKRYYSDLPYGRSYWMCCLKFDKKSPGCMTGLHDNHWLASYD